MSQNPDPMQNTGHDTGTAVAEPSRKPRTIPLYHVILLNDDDHTYEYVVEMLGQLFGYDVTRAYSLAKEVDTAGRVIVDTTTLERAELKRDQIHAYGPDRRLERCKGSMSAALAPAT